MKYKSKSNTRLYVIFLYSYFIINDFFSLGLHKNTHIRQEHTKWGYLIGLQKKLQ